MASTPERRATLRWGAGVAVVLVAGLVALEARAQRVTAADEARPRVVYSGDRAFPPYEYLEPDGTPAGFNVELVREIGQTAGVDVDVRLGTWREQLHALEAGEVDLMLLAYSDARAARYAWLDHVWTLHQVMVFRPGRLRYPRSMLDLKGETVAVEDRSLVHELIAETDQARRPTLLLARSQRDAFHLVLTGQATAAVGNALTLQAAANEFGAQAVVVEGVAAVSYRFATRPGHEETLGWLPPALARVRETGRFDRIVERYLVVAPPEGRWWDDYATHVLWALAIGAAACVAFVAWARSLRRQVRARDAAVARTARLLSLTEALAEALTPDAVARVLVDEGRKAFSAFGGFVALLDASGAWVEVAADAGYPEGTSERWRRLPLDAPLPGTEAVRTGAPVFAASRAELTARYPAVAFDVDEVAGCPTHAFGAVALSIGGRRLGVLGLSFDAPRAFSDDDRAVLLGLAKQGAQALERARLYDAERRARGEAEAASRAKDDFLATLSHELRTPLNAILGWSHMLREGVIEPDKASRALETIERNARMQTQLIADLLDISRAARDALDIDAAPVDLLQCLESALDAVRPAATSAGVELHARIDAGSYEVRGDAGRVQQILWNLLSNAIKFTASGGRVDVALEREAGWAVVRVRDTGVGIEPGHLPLIFDRFYQADASPTRRHGGLGLGLAIARHLAELHGGSVTASSEGVGRGAEFVVRLPVDVTIDMDFPTERPAQPRRRREGHASTALGSGPDKAGGHGSVH
ncbi:MAG: transporter substrate-binding domain-containing protein [Acidobacteria bacterium]|nr:transporter substrate-binding domain-containing protein [Acidobacteriota bacterium]